MRIALLALVLLASDLAAGCALSHERAVDAALPQDAAIARGPRSIDAGSSFVDAAANDAALFDAGPGPCERFFSGETNVACDPETFGACFHALAGVPCCARFATCEAGRVHEPGGVTCDDECEQLCSRITEAADCDAFGCAWLGGGCNSP